VLQPILSHLDDNPGMDADSAISLARAARDAAGGDAVPVLARLLPMMGVMDQDQKTTVGLLVSKFGESAIEYVLAYGASGTMDGESAAVLSRAIEPADEARGREFLAHVLPMTEYMDESQMRRVEDLAARYECSGMILGYAGTLEGGPNMNQALAIARLLSQINEVHGSNDGVAFLPRLLRLADGMDEPQEEFARQYAARFGNLQGGKDSATLIRLFMSSRGEEISANEAALAASALVRINTEKSYAALRELLQEKNLPEDRILGIHGAVKAAFASEYARPSAAGEVAKAAMLRAALFEKGKLAAMDSLAFEVIGEKEDTVSPSAVVINYCIDQHLTTEVDDGENIERIAKSRDILVKFGDKAIDPLWTIALSPDFSIYPEGHRTNILRTIAHIAERSTSEDTKQKARECLMEAVKNPDLSPEVVASALKVMETNVIASLRRLIYLQQSDVFQRRVCAILGGMGEKAHRQILEALNSLDVGERAAGATIQGIMLMNNPALPEALASDRKKPEKEIKFPMLHSVIRTLVHMLRDRHAPTETDPVAVIAQGALSSAGPAVPAEDLANTVRCCDEALSLEQDLWSRAAAAELLVKAEGGQAALQALIEDQSLPPAVKMHVISASTAFGGALLPAIVKNACGKGMGEKYAALKAALNPKSPLASLLEDIAIGVEDWTQKLPAAGIEAGKQPEQWQQNLFRWAVVRGLVQRSESVAVGAASSAYTLISTGLVNPLEFGNDLKHALEEHAMDTGLLPADAEDLRISRLELLAARGFDRKALGEMLGPATPFSSGKYRLFLQKLAKDKPTPQHTQQVPRANGNGVN